MIHPRQYQFLKGKVRGIWRKLHFINTFSNQSEYIYQGCLPVTYTGTKLFVSFMITHTTDFNEIFTHFRRTLSNGKVKGFVWPVFKGKKLGREEWQKREIKIDWLNHINVPVLTHAGHIGADRSLLTGHDALLLRQIARDLLHASLHRHNDPWTTFF